MTEKQNRQMSESFLIGALLAVVGGFLDAYTYLLRGGVFANAQTGNIVLLGLNLAQMRIGRVFYYLIPILAFAGGVLAAELVKRRFREHPRLHWRQIVVAVEILVLAGVAFLPRGDLDVLANVAISFLCAMQVESFRKINGSAYATTMCTGNLRSATELIYRFCVSGDPQERKKSLQYYGIILFFIAGAILGSWLAALYAERSVLFCCALLFTGFGVMFIRGESTVYKGLHRVGI